MPYDRSGNLVDEDGNIIAAGGGFPGGGGDPYANLGGGDPYGGVWNGGWSGGFGYNGGEPGDPPPDPTGGPDMYNSTYYGPTPNNPYQQNYMFPQSTPEQNQAYYGYPYDPGANNWGTGPNGEPLYNNVYTNGSYNPYTGQSGGYAGTNPYTGYTGSGEPYPGTGGGQQPINNIYNNIGGGQQQGSQYNPYGDTVLNNQARQYEADQQLRGVQGANAQRQAAADQSFQAQMAQVASQQQYYQGLLQNAQLDQQTRQYIADQSNALGMYQANLQSQYQQGLLDVQHGQLGLGYDTLNQYQVPQMQGQLANQQYSNATGLLGTQGNLLLGAGNLALNAQQIQNQNANQMGSLYLQGQLGQGQLGLGYGNLGVSQQSADTQRLQALIAGYLGQGNLELGQNTLQQTVNQANQQLAMQRAQTAASLQGPSNAFAQQRYIHGLNANGVSNAVDAIAGNRFEPRYQAAQGPVEAANLDNFSQYTGLPIPKVGDSQQQQPPQPAMGV